MGIDEIIKLLPRWYVDGTVFTFGAIVGSFLNVCIHRMPLEHSIVSPGSKCYSCEHPIRWFDNIPLLSYLLLGGKCRHCGARFSIRYWLVELLTALLFLILWHENKYTRGEVLVYLILVSGLIVATFIDFEHLIIPNEITLGGIAVGVLCSGTLPSLQNQSSHFMGALWSLSGAALGWGVLWAVL